MALAGCAAAAATLACAWLDTRMSVAALALVYLIAVVATAALLARWAAVLTSVASVSALNYFFVPPRHSFEIATPEYMLALAILLAILLAVSLGINALVASLHARRAQAEQRARQAHELHALSEQLAESQGLQAVAQVAAHWLSEHLGMPCAVFVRPDGEPDPLPVVPRDTTLLPWRAAGRPRRRGTAPFHAAAGAGACSRPCRAMRGVPWSFSTSRTTA
ncbi:hypothetical protein B2J86_10920 [Acidovorax sp. SRB_14]|nr:hypothetical protein [Acidovorax sp. SRB_14]